MNTFENIVEMFLSLISDIDYVDYDEDELNEELGMRLKMVISKARVITGLSYDSFAGELNREASDSEATIIAHGLVVEWLSPRINNFELLEGQLGSKDFTQFSNSNRLKEIRSLRDSAQSEFYYLTNTYGFDITEFEVK